MRERQSLLGCRHILAGHSICGMEKHSRAGLRQIPEVHSSCGTVQYSLHGATQNSGRQGACVKQRQSLQSFRTIFELPGSRPHKGFIRAMLPQLLCREEKKEKVTELPLELGQKTSVAWLKGVELGLVRTDSGPY